MLEPHKETVNGHQFQMLPITGGTFLMGSPADDDDGFDDERPQHEVTVSDFFLGQYPVTQALWKAVMNGKNPSHFQDDERPVEQVSWDAIQLFIRKLNDLPSANRPEGHFYRLPTEAEWEYAARGGKYHMEGYKYAGSDRLKEVGWFDKNSDNETKRVGLKYPNQLGLYDMNGNIYEWCEDDWHGNYEGAPKNGSAWIDHPERGSHRVYRGGSWNSPVQYCRAAYRSYSAPGHWVSNFGFRLALSLQAAGRPSSAF